MHDPDDVERLVVAHIHGFVGPVRPVDDAAVFAAIPTTSSHRWRFQAMFSATRFIGAAAIVALAGGSLLTGALTTPPPEERFPGMVTDEVEPGVFRILDDGAGHDLVAEQPVRVVGGPDDTVWLLGGSVADIPAGNPEMLWAGEFPARKVFELGRAGALDLGGDIPGAWSRLELDDAGTVQVLSRDGTSIFDGREWRREPPSPELLQEFEILGGKGMAVPPGGTTWPVDDVRDTSPLAGDPGETVWVYLETGPGSSMPTEHGYLVRLDGGAWDVYPAPLGWASCYVAVRLAVDPRGHVWIWFEECHGRLELPGQLGLADCRRGS